MRGEAGEKGGGEDSERKGNKDIERECLAYRRVTHTQMLHTHATHARAAHKNKLGAFRSSLERDRNSRTHRTSEREGEGERRLD